ncbi:MAG: cation-translocating P-type ATPase [Bacteroidota bacterium]|nr:cation-translocating P-type ATPase [Bacteroidota bacterium]
MAELPINIKGLTDEEVIISRKEYGNNELKHQTKSGFLSALIDTLKEPMLILLLAAGILYIISGSIGEAIFMLSAIVLVSAISLYQDSRSRNALAALKALSQPHTKVVRNGNIVEINSTDVVVNDFIIVEEGSLITADAAIIYSNDFTVNESILTGESFPVTKLINEDNKIFSGTLVSSGMAIAKVEKVGEATELGKIGASLKNIEEEKTPLQLQIRNFVKKMAIIGFIVFLIVWAFNFFESKNFVNSLLKALTLAMSVLPEEIPVAFTTFMALGAWRLMKLGIIVKQTKTVETLGSATVICVDKTGTITENKMELSKLYVHKTGQLFNNASEGREAVEELINIAMWASEPLPFDPMEVALHDAYKKITDTDVRSDYKMIHEYPLGGKPPMMTHIFESKYGKRIIAAKGAPERFFYCCGLNEEEKKKIDQQITSLALEGYRVLGVASANYEGNNFPKEQDDFDFQFIGLVSFYDPPKKNITSVFNQFYDAGINIKIVTGDNKATTETIARQIGFKCADKALDGQELINISEKNLELQVMQINIFTRMFPEAKLKIINALKQQQQIVAMTGDGVNDGPALKAAHIGIAMGKKGSDMAKSASSLILDDDDLEKMVIAIAMGRRIYSNLKKAIQYIISIHIPIILTVFIPLVLGWIYPAIFTPVHVIFLELIMGPTCSIIYENEPMEANLMQQKPRPFSNTFLSWKELNISIWQGIMITAGTLSIYQYAVSKGYNEELTRTMVFATLLMANIFLSLINRSFYYSILTTLRYKNNFLIGIVIVTILLLALMLYVPGLIHFFKFQQPNISQLLISMVVGFISVIWVESYKYYKRRTKEYL